MTSPRRPILTETGLLVVKSFTIAIACIVIVSIWACV